MAEEAQVMEEITPQAEVAEVQEQPEATAAPVVEEPKEFTYSYQPTDDLGRPLGGMQVFKAATQQELLEKVANAHKESVKAIRELNKKIRLGTVEPEQIPETVSRLDVSSIEFTPKPLTVEEKMQLSRDLLDPEKFDSAYERLSEAMFGGKPQDVARTLTQARQDIAAMRAKAEADLFIQATPEYYPCLENHGTICNWMIKNNLAPIKDNFSYAYNQLKEAGLLLEAPIVREEKPPVNSQPEVETASRITSPEPPQQKRPALASSGITRDNSIPVTATPKRGYSMADIEKMSAEEYKRKLYTDPAFKADVERLYGRQKSQE